MVLSELSQTVRDANELVCMDLSRQLLEPKNVHSIKSSNLLDTALPLIRSLHSQNALPALFFNYDRSQCEQIYRKLLMQFQESEGIQPGMEG